MLPGEDEQTLVSHEYIWQLLRRHGRAPDDLEILRAVVYSHHVRFAALRNIRFRAVMRIPPLRAAADGASSGRVLGEVDRKPPHLAGYFVAASARREALALPHVTAGPAPRAHDVPVVLAGPKATTAAMADSLQQRRPGAFRVIDPSQEAAARRAILDREAYGALVFDGTNLQVLTAPAASPNVAQLIDTLGDRIGASAGLDVFHNDLRRHAHPPGWQLTALGHGEPQPTTARIRTPSPPDSSAPSLRRRLGTARSHGLLPPGHDGIARGRGDPWLMGAAGVDRQRAALAGGSGAK